MGRRPRVLRWVRGARGVQGAGPPPERSAAGPTLAQTSVSAARFSEIYIIYRNKVPDSTNKCECLDSSLNHSG